MAAHLRRIDASALRAVLCDDGMPEPRVPRANHTQLRAASAAAMESCSPLVCARTILCLACR